MQISQKQQPISESPLRMRTGGPMTRHSEARSRRSTSEFMNLNKINTNRVNYITNGQNNQKHTERSITPPNSIKSIKGQIG